jgi:hypothetical protein
MSVLVGMMVGSRKAEASLVRDSIRTIIKNIGDGVLIAVAVASYVPQDIASVVEREAKENPGKLLLFPKYEGSYARFANTVIGMSRDFAWTIFSHDDIRLLSPNLVPQVEKCVQGKKDPVGWISFLDMDYLTPTSWAPSVREGFHKDAVRENAWSRRKTHQFHQLAEHWWNAASTAEQVAKMPFDFPKKPVRCYGPFSHFIMIESEKLRRDIKLCEDWSPVSLLIDEDWGLTAMKEGLYNIWIPQLQYFHVRPVTGTRANGLIQQYGPFVHKQFAAKWGFSHKAIYNPVELKTIRQRFARTKIPWAMDKRTYEWDYVQ